ncbi:MAG: PKD domain-containing protein, partial [Nanoarchaeota archaeon]
LISNVPQTLTITGKIEYEETGGGTTTETKVYNLVENPSLINSGSQKIFLNGANFIVPNDLGEHNFTLSLGGTKISTKQIEVKKGIEIISLNPAKTAAGLPTNFKVKVDTNNATIIKYNWDFNNDGIIDETTLTNIAEHTYDSIGNYEIIVSVEDDAEVSSSKKFNIEVGPIKDVLDELITKKQESLSDIRGEILNYDLFSSEAIENILNLDEVEEKFNNISSNYLLIKDTGTEIQFQELLSQLLEIDLPKSINQILDSAPLTFFPQKENIDLGIIETIAGGSYDADLEEEYKDAVSIWDLNNVKTKVSIKEYSANYNLGEEMLVKTFKLDINDLGAEEDSYIFVNAMEGINFKENMTYDESSGYYYKKFSSESIEFYTTEDINLEDLPVFISPSLEKLEVDSSAGIEPEEAGKKFKWGLFALIIIFLIALGFVIYLFLKKWYKTKYENYLFKNKNDLYNMVTYVHGAKQHGKKNDEIAKDLRKSGWSNEQINYIMKKYSGKNVGMPGSAEKPRHINKSQLK